MASSARAEEPGVVPPSDTAETSSGTVTEPPATEAAADPAPREASDAPPPADAAPAADENPNDSETLPPTPSTPAAPPGGAPPASDENVPDAPPDRPPAAAPRTDAPRPTPAATPPLDLSLETGWNNAVGTGVRCLFVLPGTTWSAGGGLGFTLWGPKLSLILRRAEQLESGAFFQAALGLTTGLADVAVPIGGREGRFDYTPGRTIDLAYGTRVAFGGGYAEFFLGYSVNLKGTVLQRPNADGELLRLSEDDKASLLFGAPGGLGAGASWGATF